MRRCSKRAEQEASSRTMTMMFVDIAGSTELVDRLGDDAWMEVRARFERATRHHVEETGGTIVKFQGDGCMVVFPSARRALECARGIQQAFAPGRESGSPAISVRIGVHTGEVVALENDFFGRSVVVAARVADQAEGGEVLVTQVTREVIQGSGDFSFGASRSARLKGLSGSFMLHALDVSSNLRLVSELS